MPRLLIGIVSACVGLAAGVALTGMLLTGNALSPLRPILQNSHHLERDLQTALDRAEAEARQAGRRELDSWHHTILARVDNEFLDEYLRFTAKWGTTARYLWTTAISGSDTAISDQLEAQDKLFQDKVISETQLRSDLVTIAEAMIDAFASTLERELPHIARRHHMTDTELDIHLAGTVLPVALSDNRAGLADVRRVRKRLMLAKRVAAATSSLMRALHDLAMPPGKELIHAAAAKEGGAAGGKAALKAAAHKAAAASAKATAAKTGMAAAAKVGGALKTGPFVLVALAGVVAWEWWDHSKSVAEQKPRLLQQIGEALADYESALLEPDGKLGDVLLRMKAVLANGS